MPSPDIRVIFQPDGVKDVIDGMRSIRRETQALKRDASGALDPFSQKGGFVNLFERARPEARLFGFELQSIIGTAQRLVPVLGFAGAVTGIVSLGRNALQTASDVSKLRDQFKLTAEEITTLRFAARTNEATNEDIERGIAGLAKSQRELREGADDVVAAYADLNLTAKDFQGLNLAQSFELIGQRLQGIDPTRLNLDAVLGRNARRLIPTLNKLASDGLAGVQREGERAGAILGGKAADGAKEFSDQVDLAKEAVDGLGNVVTGNSGGILAPLIKGFNLAINTITALLRLDVVGAVKLQVDGLLRLAGFAKDLPKPNKGAGNSATIDEAAQRQLIEVNRKRADEQFKLLDEENRRRRELAEASIERERDLAVARTAGSRNQIQAAQDVLNAESKALQQRLDLATSTNRTAQNIVETRYQTELALARQASASDAGFAARRVEIDRRAAQDRAKIAQTYYSELQRLEAAALAQFRASKDAQKSLENELFAIQKSADEFKFESSQAGAGPISQSIDREKRALEQISQLKDLVAKQDVERARQLRSDIEAQARTIAGLDTVGASGVGQRILAQANAVFQPLLQQQIEVERQREASAKKSIADIKSQIQFVEQEITRLQANPLNVKVAVDDAAMQSLVRSIQDQLGRTPFQIAVQPIVSGASGSVPGFADGGLLPGSSPSPKADNLLFRGTAGEFMQPVRAVQHYGLDFMESIRNLDLPRFGDGGLLGGGSSSGAGGVTERMELSLTIGGQRLGSVFGSRDTVRKLATALREMGT